jgi:acid phosphatase type 7
MKLGKLGRLKKTFRVGWILVALICLAALVHGADHSASGLLSQAGPTFTVPAPEGSWTLIAYGDMRFTDPSNQSDTNPVARQSLIQRIAVEKPSVLLLSGDVPFHGGEANDYAVYERETAPWRTAGVKVFPALGNHELYSCLVESKCLENWWNTFPELRRRRWYSVRFGNAYIITVDSNLDLQPGSRQSKWVAKQLAQMPHEINYVFVSLHHPPVADPILNNPSHNVRPNEEALAQQLETAAKRMSAKIIVIAGHIHAYERFERGGVEYLVSGGGGARPYPIARSPKDLYQDNVFPNYHYVKFVSQGGSLRATMYRLDERGGFVPSDSFEVNSASSVAAK